MKFRIINVEERVVSRAEDKADKSGNSYRGIDNFAYVNNRVQ